jgi:inorganic pyrophosphatase
VAIHPWHDIPLPDDVTTWFPVYVEIPRRSNVKYELDKTLGLLRVDRILYSAVYYPAHYGFVPRTYCDDGDPIDALVLGQGEVIPGVLLRARAIGVLRMHDEKGVDDKLLAVHIDDPEYADYRDLDQLPAHRLRELERFFLDYKVLEGKQVTVPGFQGPEQAQAILREAIAYYSRTRQPQG